jgi:CO/xanthine dehydrogenase Mo-binding subunit
VTEYLNKEFSRRTFLKGGGALIVGFGLAGVGAGKGSAATDPYGSAPLDHSQLDTWIAVHADNTASIKSGSITQGTGATTGILMIAAEELDLDMSQVKHVVSDTAVTPETGTKAASNTITSGAGRGVRAAAAHARQALLELASRELGVPASQLSVSKGVVAGGGRSVTYGALIGDRLFNVALPASYEMHRTGGFGFTGGLGAGVAPAKPVSQYKLVGTRVREVDIPAIASGSMTYVQHIKLPGMLHGRVVRPRGQAVYGFGAPILSVDASSIKHIRSARVLRKGDFLGVVAASEYDAIQAAAQLKVKWAEPPKVLPGNGNEPSALRALDTAGRATQSRQDQDFWLPTKGNAAAGLASAAHVVSQSYNWASHLHNPMGAGCMVADVTPQGARIFAGTQGVYRIRSTVAPVLGLPLSRIRVTAVAMGGAFGTSEYVDSAVAAALLSQLAGSPVRLQMMRWDEIGWGNSGPGTLVDLRAGIDTNGKIVAYEVTQFYPQYKGGEETSGQLSGLTPSTRSSMQGNYYPGPMYDVPNASYLNKSIPTAGTWFKTAWFRAGSGPSTAFAGEQVIDELAKAANMDPVAFRLHNLRGGEMRTHLEAVANAVTRAAKWQPGVAASQLSSSNVARGRGFAWSYTQNTLGAAAIADVEVNKRTGKVTVKHVYEAFSPGLVINPALVENQIIGSVTQVVSRLLVEQLRYSKSSVTSSDFVTYPMLRIMDAPRVTPIAVNFPDAQARGVGEPPTVPVPAAVANAVFDATGVRLKSAPFTPARVRAALRAAGK